MFVYKLLLDIVLESGERRLRVFGNRVMCNVLVLELR